MDASTSLLPRQSPSFCNQHYLDNYTHLHNWGYMPRAHGEKGGLSPCLAQARCPPTVGRRSRPPPLPLLSKIYFSLKKLCYRMVTHKKHFVSKIRCD